MLASTALAKKPAGPLLHTLPQETRLVASVDLTALMGKKGFARFVAEALSSMPSELQVFRDDAAKVRRVTFVSFAPLGSAATSDAAVVIEGGFNTRRMHKLMSTIATEGNDDLSVASLPSGAVAIGDKRVVKRLLTARFGKVKQVAAKGPIRRTLKKLKPKNKRSRAIVIATRGFADFTGLGLSIDMSSARATKKTGADAVSIYASTSAQAAKDLATQVQVFRLALKSPGVFIDIRDRMADAVGSMKTATSIATAATQLFDAMKLSRPDKKSLVLSSTFDGKALVKALVRHFVNATKSDDAGIVDGAEVETL